MPYAAIPQDIKYEEQMLGPLTLKQSIYVLIAVVFATIIFLMKMDMGLKIVLIGAAALFGIAFGIFKADEVLEKYIDFLTSPRKVSWISPISRQFMGIRTIRADTVFFIDGRMVGVIEVKPINFSVLSQNDQDAVIYGFKQFLNSLSFPVQIVMRSVELNLDPYLNQLKRKVAVRNDEIAIGYYEEFARFITNFLKVNRINDRFFYVIVPGSSKGTDDDKLRELDNRCRIIANALGLSGISARRLETPDLVTIYSSYFTETFEINETYLSPVTRYSRMRKLREYSNIRKTPVLQKSGSENISPVSGYSSAPDKEQAGELKSKPNK